MKAPQAVYNQAEIESRTAALTGRYCLTGCKLTDRRVFSLKSYFYSSGTIPAYG